MLEYLTILVFFVLLMNAKFNRGVCKNRNAGVQKCAGGCAKIETPVCKNVTLTYKNSILTYI